MALVGTKRRLQGIVRAAHLALADRGLPQKVAIYMHSLEKSDYASLEGCVAHLRDRGYRFVQAEEFLDEAVSQVALLSFDDNYRAWYQALSLLDLLGVKATFYVNTLPLRDSASPEVVADYFERVHHPGERIPLDAAELCSIRDAGHAIGAHGHAHTMLTALPAKEAEQDILRSKQILEEILGEEIHHFSYPFGMRRHFNRHLLGFCQRIGFRTVASAIPGLQHGGHRPFQINRTLWRLERPLESNLQNLSIDGRLFERLTGLSPVG